MDIMVRLHCPTLRQIPIHFHRTQWESVLVSVSVWCEHLGKILYNPFLCLWIDPGVGKCGQTVSST